MTSFATGAVIGLLGGAHCVAMCGPLATLLPRGRHAAGCYHAGRVLMYIVLGGVAGAAGEGLAVSGLGRGLAIAAGLTLIVMGIGAAYPFKPAALSGFRASAAFARRAAAMRHTHPLASASLLGVSNGLLPCSLLYAALVAAAGLGSMADGLALAGGFGAATVVWIGAAQGVIRVVAPRVPRGLRRLTPVGVALVGALLIARGLEDAHTHDRPAAATPVSEHAH